MTSRRVTPPLVVLVDLGEQRPLSPFVWRTAGGSARRVTLTTERCTLAEGDYAVRDIEGAWRVERKSLSDLWQSLYGKHDEPDALGEEVKSVDVLRREFGRMQRYPRRCILVEGGVGSFEDPPPRPGEPLRTLVAYAQHRYERNRRKGRTAEQNVLGILDMLAAFDLDYGVPTQWAGSRSGAAMWLGTMAVRLWSQATGGDKADTVRRRGLTRADLPWLGAVTGEVEPVAPCYNETAAPAASPAEAT